MKYKSFFFLMTLNKKSDCCPVISGAFLSAVFKNVLKIDHDQNFKEATILLQCGRIRRDKQTVFMINSLLFIITLLTNNQVLIYKTYCGFRALNHFLLEQQITQKIAWFSA